MPQQFTYHEPTEHKKYKSMNMEMKEGDQESMPLLWGEVLHLVHSVHIAPVFFCTGLDGLVHGAVWIGRSFSW
jgi:hypothetical protein